MKNGNSMMFLNLYKTENTWQFDDDKFEIVAEPFILGMSEMISSYLTVNTINCTAIFSLSKFPECETLKLLNEEAAGGWYEVTSSYCKDKIGMKGWLCPVTRVYLNAIPKYIYFKIENY
jgi:hypothetical protein